MEPKRRGIKKKVVAGAAVAVAIPAAVGVAKKILGDADQQGEPQRSEPEHAARPEQTKEQLYATAKRLNIEGRSKMSKQQLERAIARAGGE
jgi:hypothetical protein